MGIFSSLALGYQKSLISASLDYFSASDLLPNVFGGQFGKGATFWKEAVIEFLRINLAVGFIEVAQVDDNSGFISEGDQVLQIFSESDPSENPEIWMAIRFAGTEKLNLIVVAQGLCNWESVHGDLNKKFVGDVFETYIQYPLLLI